MIAVGERLPSANLVKVTPNGPEAVDAQAYFAGRRVALFAVPGAFTPTCSAQHLPSFLTRADELRARGVDEIACTAVNDAFVLDAWSKQNDAGGVTMLADGNGHFAEALGLDADVSKIDAKLGNADFLKRAPEEVVEEQRERRDEALSRKAKMEEALGRLKDA